MRAVDIGGGLAVDYFPNDAATEAIPGPRQGTTPTPALADYARQLAAAAPSLFPGYYGGSPQPIYPHRQLITEFGKALVAGAGVVVAKVEDVIWWGGEEGGDAAVGVVTSASSTSSTAGARATARATAVLHAGADLLLRECYLSSAFSHRMALTREGVLLGPPCGRQGQGQLLLQGSQLGLQCTLVGPLCFAGDVLGDVWLPGAGGGALAGPAPRRGDDALVFDCGANSLALFSRHCSRQAPGVWVVWDEGEDEVELGGGPESAVGAVRALCVKPRETHETVNAFWS